MYRVPLCVLLDTNYLNLDVNEFVIFVLLLFTTVTTCVPYTNKKRMSQLLDLEASTTFRWPSGSNSKFDVLIGSYWDVVKDERNSIRSCDPILRKLRAYFLAVKLISI